MPQGVPNAARTVIVAVGDELLGGFTLDTNSHWLAQQVRDAGWPVHRIEVVADRDEDIVAAIHRAGADAPPGIPREMQAIVGEEILPRFFAGGVAPVVRQLDYSFAIEAQFFEPMRLLEREFPEVSVGSYPQTETRHLIIRVSGTDPARVDAA